MIEACDTACFETSPAKMAMIARRLPQFAHLTDAAIRSWFAQRAVTLVPADRARLRDPFYPRVVESVWRGRPEWRGCMSWGAGARMSAWHHRNHDCPVASFAHLDRNGCPYELLRWRYVGKEMLRLATRCGATCSCCGCLFSDLEITTEAAWCDRWNSNVVPRRTPVRARFFSFVWGHWPARVVMYDDDDEEYRPVTGAVSVRAGLPEFCDPCLSRLRIPKVSSFIAQRPTPGYAFSLLGAALPGLKTIPAA